MFVQSKLVKGKGHNRQFKTEPFSCEYRYRTEGVNAMFCLTPGNVMLRFHMTCQADDCRIAMDDGCFQLLYGFYAISLSWYYVWLYLIFQVSFRWLRLLVTLLNIVSYVLLQSCMYYCCVFISVVGPLSLQLRLRHWGWIIGGQEQVSIPNYFSHLN